MSSQNVIQLGWGFKFYVFECMWTIYFKFTVFHLIIIIFYASFTSYSEIYYSNIYEYYVLMIYVLICICINGKIYMLIYNIFSTEF